MPILNLHRKLTEVGRIRLGAKSGKGAPTKLETFRLTSKSKDAIEAAASVYGGTIGTWNGPDGQEFELVTATKALNVVVPPGNALSQWYEMWSGAGCQRRCDGQTETLSGGPCVCPTDQQQRAEMSARGQACRPTTRLSVILPEVKSVGIWRLETHGYHAATELAGIAELLEKVSANDRYLPATLRLEPRSSRRGGKVSRFVVPVLEVGATVQEAIAASAGSDAPQVEYRKMPSVMQHARAAISEPDLDIDTSPQIAQVQKVEQPKPVVSDEPPLDDNPFSLDEPSPVEEVVVEKAPKPINHVTRIQILKRELGLTDDQYRAGLAKYGVTSSKDLTTEQAAEVVEKLSAALAKKKASQ
jgi:hypothetical protein